MRPFPKSRLVGIVSLSVFHIELSGGRPHINGQLCGTRVSK